MKNSISLKSQMGSQLWKTLENYVDVNRAWEPIMENIKISAKECPGYYKLKHKPIIRPRETSPMVMVTRFNLNKWRQAECEMCC
jgi:hypothetical protein